MYFFPESFCRLVVLWSALFLATVIGFCSVTFYKNRYFTAISLDDLRRNFVTGHGLFWRLAFWILLKTRVLDFIEDSRFGFFRDGVFGFFFATAFLDIFSRRRFWIFFRDGVFGFFFATAFLDFFSRRRFWIFFATAFLDFLHDGV